MVLVLGVNGMTPLAWLVLGLFVSLFAWIALALISGICGFVSLLAGGGRPRSARARAAARRAHRPADAGLQRSAGAHHGGARDHPWRAAPARRAAAGSTSSSSATPPTPAAWIAEEAAFLTLRDRVGGRRLLPPPAQEHRAQGRQHRRLGAALGRRLPAFPDPRRRQRHDRRLHRPPGRRDGADPGCRADPDPAGDRRRPHAVRPHAAIRRPALRPADRARPRLVAAARRAITGATTPSSAPAPSPTLPGCPRCAGASRSAATS